MRTETIEIYTYEELSPEAQERARQWWISLQREDFDWVEESRESITTFCNHFGVSLHDWSVGPYECFTFTTDGSNDHFRGFRLKDCPKDDYAPTGYCLDFTLWSAFRVAFEETGDAKRAFGAALRAAFADWRDDMEYQLTDEYAEDAIIANEYEFTKNGEI